MTAHDDTPPPASHAERPRSVLRRLLGLAALAADLTLLAILTSWVIGRSVSDRYLWSQYLGWIPTEAVALAAVAILIFGIIFRRRRPRIVVSLPTLLILIWLIAGEWRLHRLLRPAPRDDTPRVLFMNISPRGRDADIAPLFNTRPDIAILSNVHPQPVTFEKIYGVRHVDLLERFTGRVPGDAAPGDAHLLRYGMFHVYSQHPIRRRASAHVGSQESWLANDTGGGGAILMLELDTPTGPLIIWAVDMPSTLGASRRVLFEQAREKIDALDRALAIDTVGRWIAADLPPDDPLRTPDLVVGDFNTPAHAWSVARLAPGTRNARADAGTGPPGTFMATAPFPFFEIDLARLGPRIRAERVATVRAPGCRHLGLLLAIEPADAP